MGSVVKDDDEASKTSVWSKWASSTAAFSKILSSKREEAQPGSPNRQLGERQSSVYFVEPEAPLLEAALDVREGKRGTWKKLYVELGADQETLVAHKSSAPLRKNHPTRLDPVVWTLESNDWQLRESSISCTIVLGTSDRSYWLKFPDETTKSVWVTFLQSNGLLSERSRSRAISPLPSQRKISDSTQPTIAHETAELLAQKPGAKSSERFLIKPEYAYRNVRMNRDELRVELNKPSQYYHKLQSNQETIGNLNVEILQCFGLPKLSSLRDPNYCVVAVLGQCAFRSDIIPLPANPMWLSRMRRACTFPVSHAYARLYVGVFDDNGETTRDEFVGRVVIDLARLRPRSTYDITLPLRQSAHVYMREARGSIRLRFSLSWKSERAAMLSYLPSKRMPKISPHEQVTVACADQQSYQNVARTVHGAHMPGRFSMKLLKAVVREINFTRIHVLRYMRKREMRNLCTWSNPCISGFIFLAWMHSIYHNTVAYVPGHVLTVLVLYLWRNYARYAMDGPRHRGFLAPSWEEIGAAVLWGSKNRHYIEPLAIGDSAQARDGLQPQTSNGSLSEPVAVSIKDIAEAFRLGVKQSRHRYRLRTYNHVFNGSQAVDFLVNRGFAFSRENAVEIGQKLQKMKLFEHVAREHDFKDERLYYVFLVRDPRKLTLQTAGHKPMGKWLFRLLGFVDDSENFSRDQLEFPYSEGNSCPRFTVQQSLLIRSKESKRLLERMSANEDEEDDDDLDRMNMSAIGGDGDKATKSAMRRLDQLIGDEKAQIDASVRNPQESEAPLDPSVTVKVLKKPPNQDLVSKNTPNNKPITAVLEEARHKVHGVLLHAFNDKLAVVDGSFSSKRITRQVSRKVTPTNKLAKLKSKFGPSRNKGSDISDRSIPGGTLDDLSDRSKVCEATFEALRDESDKLLGVGRYSHPNPWLSKIGIIVQPIVEIALGWLSLFRALFNMFTWQDPILSFWVSVLAPVVIVALHVFPWRLALGVAGVVLFGPQNWMWRLYQESKGVVPPDMDTIIRKKKKAKLSHDLEDEPLFTHATIRNESFDSSQLDRSQVRKIAVPYSPLLYSHRFYDWPPEPEYARVVANEESTQETRKEAPLVLELPSAASRRERFAKRKGRR